jgi:hypothetical protein
MKAFLITAGTVFALITVVHIVRVFGERALARDPIFILLTLVPAALSAWAWREWRVLNRRP